VGDLELRLPGLAALGNCTASDLQVHNADVLIPTTGLVDERAIRSAPKLKLITQPAAGHNNIAVEAATSLGIPVCTAPGGRPPLLPCLGSGLVCCRFDNSLRCHE
jgi:hypothetical protein